MEVLRGLFFLETLATSDDPDEITTRLATKPQIRGRYHPDQRSEQAHLKERNALLRQPGVVLLVVHHVALYQATWEINGRQVTALLRHLRMGLGRLFFTGLVRSFAMRQPGIPNDFE